MPLRERSLEEWFTAYADRFEKATSRAEFDETMRLFLSAIHHIALRDHWQNGGSGKASDAVRRISAVHRKFREPAPQAEPAPTESPDNA